MTEVYNTNTNTDLIFFSVEADSEACLVEGLYNSNAPDGGCVMSFDITLDSTLSAKISSLKASQPSTLRMGAPAELSSITSRPSPRLPASTSRRSVMLGSILWATARISVAR